MANRADRRRQMRELQAINDRKRLQGQFDAQISAARDEEQRIKKAISEIQSGMNGGYSEVLKQKEDLFRKQMEVKMKAREQVRKIIEQGGITAQDLDNAREEGRQEGFKQAALPIIKCCYAGIILALHDEFGFGENRCFRAIKAVDEKIMWALNHSELCDEVLEKTGLELDLDEPFDRVTKKEK